MDLIVFYIILSLIISFVSYSWHFKGALRKAINSGVENEFTNSPKLASLVYIILGMLISPALLFVLMMPGAGTVYERTMYNTINDK